MRRWSLLALAVLGACGDRSDPAPPAATSEGSPAAPSVQLDTLGGFQLGSTYAETETRATEGGVRLECQEEEGTRYCSPVESNGAVTLAFSGDTLQLINWEPHPGRSGVPLDSVRSREQPFGAPEVDAERPDSIYLGLWLNPERSAMRTVFCQGVQVQRACAVAVERTRPELVAEQVGRWRQMARPDEGS